MLKEIREEMARLLNQRMPDVVWNAYVFDQAPPSGFIYPGGLGDTVIDYDLAFGRGADGWSFVVEARIATIGDDIAQQNLDEMIEPFGALSVKESLEAVRDDAGNITLGGLVDNLRVVSCSGYRRYLTEGRAPTLGAEWEVKVLAKGKP